MLGFMRYPPSPLVESPPILRAANRLVHAIVSSTLLIQFRRHDEGSALEVRSEGRSQIRSGFVAMVGHRWGSKGRTALTASFGGRNFLRLREANRVSYLAGNTTFGARAPTKSSKGGLGIYRIT